MHPWLQLLFLHLSFHAWLSPFSPSREEADHAVLSHPDPEGGGPGPHLAEEGAAVRGRGRQQGQRHGGRPGAGTLRSTSLTGYAVTHSLHDLMSVCVCVYVSGLRGVSVREALPAAVHLPEEEPQEEADGLLLVLHVREIPLRAAQLHRPARHGHPRKSCSHRCSVLLSVCLC